MPKGRHQGGEKEDEDDDDDGDDKDEDQNNDDSPTKKSGGWLNPLGFGKKKGRGAFQPLPFLDIAIARLRIHIPNLALSPGPSHYSAPSSLLPPPPPPPSPFRSLLLTPPLVTFQLPSPSPLSSPFRSHLP